MKLPEIFKLSSASLIAGSGFALTALISPIFSNKFDSMSASVIFEAAPVSFEVNVNLPPESTSALTPAALAFIKFTNPPSVVF